MRLLVALRALARPAASVALLTVAFATSAFAQTAKPAPAAAAAAVASGDKSSNDDFRVQLILAEQIDRFNPGVAASENSVAAGGMATGLEFEFHAANLWMPKKIKARPQIVFGGRLLSSERVLAQSVATEIDTVTGEAPDSIEVFPDAKSIELMASFRIRYPLAVGAGAPQTAVYFRAESGAIFAEHMTVDLL